MAADAQDRARAACVGVGEVSEIRVLEAITSARIGGAEVFVADLCEHLPGLGAHVELFCPQGRPFVDYAAKRGIEATTWRTRGKFDPITVVRLARLIKSHGIDVVHTHLSTASLLVAFAARLAGRPSVAHVHGLNTATCFRYSNRVIAVSEAVKRHLVAQGLPDGRIRVVHNGVDLSRFEPVDLVAAKLKLGYHAYAPLFGVFGRLSREKGQRVAIEAMFLVVKDYPSARLVLAGVGPDQEELETTAKALGTENNVQFAGFVQNVRHLMSACDAVMVPSLKEGFGLAAVEAMALERPVVASQVGGLPEIVVPDETGLLVKPNDPQALAQALLSLANNKTQASEFGAAGRHRVEERFYLDKQIGLVFEILRELL